VEHIEKKIALGRKAILCEIIGGVLFLMNKKQPDKLN